MENLIFTQEQQRVGNRPPGDCGGDSRLEAVSAEYRTHCLNLMLVERKIAKKTSELWGVVW